MSVISYGKEKPTCGRVRRSGLGPEPSRGHHHGRVSQFGLRCEAIFGNLLVPVIDQSARQASALSMPGNARDSIVPLTIAQMTSAFRLGSSWATVAIFLLAGPSLMAGTHPSSHAVSSYGFWQ